jgi:DNA-binding NarL/FixJ family response regulator
MFVEALRAFFSRTQGIEVVATVTDGRLALAKGRSERPHVAVLNWFLPGLNGPELARVLIEEGYCENIVLTSEDHDDQFVLDALESGAKAYLPKTRSASELLKVVRYAAEGSTTISRQYAEVLARAVKGRSFRTVDSLTRREREALQLIAEGRSTKEIAAQLNVATKTAAHARERLMKKLDIHTVAALTRHAIRLRLIRP